jgi:adenylate cyclase
VTKKPRLLIIGFIFVVIIPLGLQYTPLIRSMDYKVLDSQFRILRARYARDSFPNPIIVGINEETFQVFREPLALWHPHLGLFFEAMAVAHPKLVVLDVVLPDRSYDYLVPGYDRRLLTGLLKLKRSTPVFLAQTVDEQGNLRPIFAPIISLAGRERVGLALVKTEADGTVRRFESTLNFSGGQSTTLVGRVGAHLGLAPGSGIIDYTHGPAYSYVPLQEVTARLQQGDAAWLRQRFADQRVLLGSVLVFEDRHAAPVDLAAWEPGNTRIPGVLLQAHALRSLITDGLIKEAPFPLALVLTALGSSLYWLIGRPMWGVILVCSLLVTAWVFSAFTLSRGLYVQVTGFSLGMVLALSVRMGLEGGLAFRERRRLRGSFGRYVSPNVLQEILDGKLRPGVGGTRCRVCVLFSDIRSFTTRSEQQPPEAVILLLNRYFNEMTVAIHAHGGTVDKFIGDGLMAFFGAPNPRAHPSRDAFNTASDMLARLEKLNKTLMQENIEPIKIGVGLHTGEVVAGHVGSQRRHEYTAIGDTVNTASRLEGLTKSLGYPVICSDIVAAELGSYAVLRDLGQQAIKGRAPVRVFGWQPPSSWEMTKD